MNSDASASSVQQPESLDAALRFILESGEHQLPVLPEVAAELLRQTNDINCELPDIVNLIRRDQSLTGHLLQITNSARYNFGAQTVSSVQQAVARLGLLKVREIVVVISCQCRIFDVPGFESDVRNSFRHSLATAVYAQETARIRRRNVEDAFLSGLLYDVGRPVLLQALMDRRRTAGLVAGDDELRQAAEDHRVGIATRLVGLWELPSRISEAIFHQDIPLDVMDACPGASILNLAIDLARLSLSADVMPKVESFSHPMTEVLNLYPEQVQELLNHHEQVLDWVNTTA